MSRFTAVRKLEQIRRFLEDIELNPDLATSDKSSLRTIAASAGALARDLRYVISHVASTGGGNR